jgi:hypothetical protein
MKPIKKSGGNGSSQPDSTEIATEVTTTEVETQTSKTEITNTDTTRTERTQIESYSTRVGTEPVSTPEPARPRKNSKWHSFMPTKIKKILVASILFLIPLILVKCAFRADPTIPATALNSQGSPQAGTNSSSSNNDCTADLPNRMKQANITSQQIDLLFAQKYPERKNTKIGKSSQDTAFKQKWCKLAEQEIGTKKK